MRNYFLMTGADSLTYLSVEGLQRAVQFNMKTKHRKESGHCTACLTGLSTNCTKICRFFFN